MAENQQGLEVFNSLSRQQWETQLQSEQSHGIAGSDMHARQMSGFVPARMGLPDIGKRAGILGTLYLKADLAHL